MKKTIIVLLLLAVMLVGGLGGCSADKPLTDAIYTESGLYPSENNTGSLGSSSLAWGVGWFKDLHVDGVINITLGPGVEVDPAFTASPASGITAGDITGWNSHPALTTKTHGVMGTILGTSDNQTLTNKTFGDALNMDTHQINNVVDPTLAQDVATKNYVDTEIYDEGARVYHNADQAITTLTLTTLAFNSERYDTDTIHSTTDNNSRLTCKTAGKYLIVFHGYWAANATGVRQVEFRLNGTTSILYETPRLNANNTVLHIATTIYDLAVNDYVEVRVWQTSGGNLNFLILAPYSPEFMMQRVGD